MLPIGNEECNSMPCLRNGCTGVEPSWMAEGTLTCIDPPQGRNNTSPYPCDARIQCHMAVVTVEASYTLGRRAGLARQPMHWMLPPVELPRSSSPSLKEKRLEGELYAGFRVHDRCGSSQIPPFSPNPNMNKTRTSIQLNIDFWALAFNLGIRDWHSTLAFGIDIRHWHPTLAFGIGIRH